MPVRHTGPAPSRHIPTAVCAGRPVTLPTTDPEIVAALRDLARLVSSGVPGCDGASISLLADGEPSTLAASHGHIRTLDQAQYSRQFGPCVTAMREATEVTVEDYTDETRWPEVEEDLRDAGVRSSLSLPLSQSGRVIGGLNMYAQAPRSFGATSRDAAQAFARQAVVMLGYLQQLHAERAARLQERELSAALQRSLLPTLPDLPGISCAARYLVGSAHAQVGGDWYDLFALPDGAIGVAIGDVMGHDLAAAAAMGQLRSVLRSYAYEGSSPSVVLDRLDRLVQDFEMAQLAPRSTADSSWRPLPATAPTAPGCCCSPTPGTSLRCCAYPTAGCWCCAAAPRH